MVKDKSRTFWIGEQFTNREELRNRMLRLGFKEVKQFNKGGVK